MQAGKSLAIEYAYRVRDVYPKTWVFWVHASNAARFEESYKNIAERVQMTAIACNNRRLLNIPLLILLIPYIRHG